MTQSRPAPSRTEILLVGTAMLAVSAAILFAVLIGSPATPQWIAELAACAGGWAVWGCWGAYRRPWRAVPPRELAARFGRSYARAYLGALLSLVALGLISAMALGVVTMLR